MKWRGGVGFKTVAELSRAEGVGLNDWLGAFLARVVAGSMGHLVVLPDGER